jgi:hypothetical protein
MTKQTGELVDVTLDDGRTVRCTPEHLWMLRNGTYKEAQSLVAGIDRLMPCKPAIWSEWITGAGENHRVRRVERVTLAKAVPVYDLEVDVWSNFALDAGVYVHNSKDCSDAVAGVCGYLAAFGHEALVTQDDYPTYTVDEVVPDYEPAMAFGPESSEMEMVADDFIAFGPE